MISIKRISLLFCLIVPLFVLAQNPTSNCTDAITLSSQVMNFKVYTYPANTFVGMSFTSKSQVKNLFPEELMASILSANTQEWVNYNEIELSTISNEKIKQINIADRRSNYFELLQKIEFEANGTTYVLIKFKLTVENSPKPMYMTETMAFKDNRWMRVTESALTPLIFMTGMSQSKYLTDLFNNQKSGNTIFDRFIDLSIENNHIDLNKFLKVTEDFAIKEGIGKMQFMLESDMTSKVLSNNLITNFSEFKSVPKQVQFSYPLRNVEYCEYFNDDTNIQNDTTDFGKVVLSKENLAERADSSLTYIHKLKFDFNFRNIEILKYIVKLNENAITKSVWIEHGKEVEPIFELQNLQYAIQCLRPKSFWSFYNSDDSRISEIDKIKSQFKTPEDILDIDRLGAYLKTKPKELEKYCDY